MKTLPRRIVLGLLALVVVATLIILPLAMAGPGEDPTRRWEPQEPFLPTGHPPNRPPAVSLGFADGSSSRQEGVIVQYDWVIDGRARSFEMRPPIVWPPTLRGSFPLLIEIAAEVPPHSLQLRLYDRIEATGIPEGRPMMRRCGLGGSPDEGCSLARDGGGWRAVIEGIPSGREYYVAASAMWFVPSTVPQPPSRTRASEVAARLFHVEG